MRVERPNGNLTHVSAPPSKDGEEAFNQFTRSKGNTAEDIKEEVAKKTRLTRNTPGRSLIRNTSLLEMAAGIPAEEERVYRTTLDGVIRHIAWA
jgi:hypothetical protein